MKNNAGRTWYRGLFVSIISCVMLLVGSVSVHAQSAPPFLHDLRFGVQDQDVIALQQFLNAHGAPLDSSGPGSTGHEVPYFGPRTQSALMRYQTAHAGALGIVRGTGFFGPITRAYVNNVMQHVEAPLPPAPDVAPVTYRVSGQLTGRPAMVTVQLNGQNAIQVDPEHPQFIFAQRLSNNEAYEVTVTQSPANVVCHVSENGKGVVHAAPVSVIISCEATLSVGNSPALPVSAGFVLHGDAVGIAGPLTVSAGAGRSVTIAPGAASAFDFPIPFTAGSAYEISIVQTPSDQACYIDQATGTVGRDTLVHIACVRPWEQNPFLHTRSRTPIVEFAGYTVGGMISGLTGTLSLLNNGASLLITTMNGAFAFNAPLDEGDTYNVTVLAQPEAQTCMVTNGSGTMGASDITSVNISCGEIDYCIDDPCAHGTCTSGEGTFTCECDPCFLGPTCQIFDTLDCA